MFESRIGLVVLIVSVMAVAAGTSEVAAATDDVVFADYDATNRVCESDGTGGFVCSDVSPDENLTYGVALGLIDGDPHLDAVFSTESNQTNRVCFGDGVGGFANCQDVSADEEFSPGVALGDINGDSSLDIFFANIFVADQVCLGDGSGGFTCSFFDTGTLNSFSVALGFVDADANLDAVVGDNFGVNRICLGDGSGGFACSDVDPGSNFPTREVALGFVDGDSNLDLVVANQQSTGARVCLGDGTGGFSCALIGGTDDYDSWGVSLGLVDNDPHLDAVFSNYLDENGICLGDGLGGFTCADVSEDTFPSTASALGHFDGDGNLDVVFANVDVFGLVSNRVCFGDGLGGFTCDDVSGDTRNSLAVAARDLTALIFADGFESGDASAWSESEGLDLNIGVFVSSDSFSGGFGGLAFADATCQSLGSAAIPDSGPWVAWLSDSSTDALNRIPQPDGVGTYVRASFPGIVIADDLADLTDGSLDNQVGDFDEDGNPVAGNPWTGTDSDGTVSTSTCLDWTSNQNSDAGVVGDRLSTGSAWTNTIVLACDQPRHFYCFGAVR